MDYEEGFGGITELLVKMADLAHNPRITEGDLIVLFPAARTQVVRQFSDLFSVARVLAGARELIEIKKVSVRLDLSLAGDPGRTAVERLTELGVSQPEWIPGFNATYSHSQADLGLDDERGSQRLDHPGVFWRCVSPFREVEVGWEGNERRLLRIVHEEAGKIASDMGAMAESLGMELKEFGSELPKLLYTILGELMGNAISHSQSPWIFTAVTVSRTPGLALRFLKDSRIESKEIA